MGRAKLAPSEKQGKKNQQVDFFHYTFYSFYSHIYFFYNVRAVQWFRGWWLVIVLPESPGISIKPLSSKAGFAVFVREWAQLFGDRSHWKSVLQSTLSAANYYDKTARCEQVEGLHDVTGRVAGAGVADATSKRRMWRNQTWNFNAVGCWSFAAGCGKRPASISGRASERGAENA